MFSTLPPGPLDIVGDVHGELDALRSLLTHAGYSADGDHPDGRTLVFVGDLVDRGPDSPGVVRLVKRLIDAGRALAVLGNHELNLLRGKQKPGNDWFWATNQAHDERYKPWAELDAGSRKELLDFFGQLPLVIQRQDLRVVHAAWHGPSIAALAGTATGVDTGSLFATLEKAARDRLDAEGLAAAARAEKAHWRHRFADPSKAMPMLSAVGQLDEQVQMLNPLRVLTSGHERCTSTPFFASGQWRFAERVRWWEHYEDDVPVVVGHYWRQWLSLDRAALGKGDPDVFDGTDAKAWLGPHGRVFCIDYSVGGRWSERHDEVGARRTRLAMLRWPEQVLLTDHAEQLPTANFGRATVAGS